MTAREAKREYMLKEWAGRILECSRSGMTVKAWCKENGITTRKYFYRLQQVREYAAQFFPEKVKKPEMCLDKRTAACAGMSQVMAVEQAEIAQVPVETPDGWALVQTEPDVRPAVVYKEERRPSDGGSVSVEIGRFRVRATADADEAALAKVLRTLVAIW